MCATRVPSWALKVVLASVVAIVQWVEHSARMEHRHASPESEDSSDLQGVPNGLLSDDDDDATDDTNDGDDDDSDSDDDATARPIMALLRMLMAMATGMIITLRVKLMVALRQLIMPRNGNDDHDGNAAGATPTGPLLKGGGVS